MPSPRGAEAAGGRRRVHHDWVDVQSSPKLPAAAQSRLLQAWDPIRAERHQQPNQNDCFPSRNSDRRDEEQQLLPLINGQI